MLHKNKLSNHSLATGNAQKQKSKEGIVHVIGLHLPNIGSSSSSNPYLLLLMLA